MFTIAPLNFEHVLYKNVTDLSFELFLWKVKFLYNKISPLSTLKQEMKKDNSKPWIASAILKAIHVKNKLHQQFFQAIISTHKDSSHENFKTSRKQIGAMNRLQKEDYFKTFFKTNELDSNRIWCRIKTLMNTEISKNVSHHITLNTDNLRRLYHCKSL